MSLFDVDVEEVRIVRYVVEADSAGDAKERVRSSASAAPAEFLHHQVDGSWGVVAAKEHAPQDMTIRGGSFWIKAEA